LATSQNAVIAAFRIRPSLLAQPAFFSSLPIFYRPTNILLGANNLSLWQAGNGIPIHLQSRKQSVKIYAIQNCRPQPSAMFAGIEELQRRI
jgi:hypothetical protein